eukprot:CAMPEP_0115086252 /NCGR_PEP_ID=MMETSP0227-20121206/22464_1 /TAXON_ID=89957 /ORGANISM="Polarella glacialis, Strain CCMP 1383" /LENGTH=298 /DNA_ID=CAMNT_0002475653 /DNA_START=86 /DNA_END=982 /DNA_ORIENTATION=-
MASPQSKVASPALRWLEQPCEAEIRIGQAEVGHKFASKKASADAAYWGGDMPLECFAERQETQSTEAETEPTPSADAGEDGLEAEAMLPASLLDELGSEHGEGSREQTVDVPATMSLLQSVLGKNVGLHYETDGQTVTVTDGQGSTLEHGYGVDGFFATSEEDSQEYQQYCRQYSAEAQEYDYSESMHFQERTMSAMSAMGVGEGVWAGDGTSACSDSWARMGSSEGLDPELAQQQMQQQQMFLIQQSSLEQQRPRRAQQRQGPAKQLLTGRFCVFCGKSKHDSWQRFCSFCGKQCVA